MSPQHDRRRWHRTLRLAIFVACALPFLALVAMWVFSYARSAYYMTMRSQIIYGFHLNRGDLTLYHQPYRYKFAGNQSVVVDHTREVDPVPLIPGFEKLKGSRIGGWRVRLCWPTIAFGAIAVSVAWVALRARRRFPAGQCPACGYDCRATPTRCSECGTELALAR